MNLTIWEMILIAIFIAPFVVMIAMIFALLVYYLTNRVKAKKCPFCAEFVRPDAKICFHCKKDLP